MANGTKRDKRNSERDNGREYVEKKNKKDKKGKTYDRKNKFKTIKYARR